MASLQDVTRYVCLFHDAGRARGAVTALESAGVARDAIQTIGDREANGEYASQDLTDLGVPERDLQHLEDGLKRGGVVVSLEAPESSSDEIERIFHKYNADKIDETELTTQSEVVAAAPFAAAEPALVSSGSEAVIPIAEETLQVGKRTVDRGGVRVLRHTVEQPVSEDISLHEERVVLDYREVNRPATEADVRAGSQEIELVETAEVPVVQKVARVVEEVRVGTVAEDRTETVRDTVRHTEVEVEQVDTRAERSGIVRE